jgi:hypothetical protein
MLSEADDVFSLGLWLLFVGQVVGWLALNYFGLHDNEKMHRDMKRIVEHRAPPPPGPVIFVGFASPRYHDILDAHQDIGFLSFGKDELEFIGDSQRVSLLRSQIIRVHFRPNIHSLLGLGRWIAIEGTISGRPVRMLVEPRERNTMLGNLMLGKWLKGMIDGWRKGEKVAGLPVRNS